MADDNGAPHAYRRRTVLKTLGTAGSAVTLSLAGCLGVEDGGDGGDGGDGSDGDGSSDGGNGGPVTVAGIYDLSGATSDVGRPTALGSRDTIGHFNENDTLGRQIEHPNNDYAYEVP